MNDINRIQINQAVAPIGFVIIRIHLIKEFALN